MKRGKAFDRAVEVFGECALHVRGELRAYGVRGEVRRLDDYANGKRGVGMARLLADFAMYCRERGMPEDRMAVRLREMVDGVVSEVYAGDTKGAA